jgi:anti-sigma factor RsiW
MTMPPAHAEDGTSFDLEAIGVLEDTIDEMRKESAELRRDSAFTQAELRRYERWRMKKKCEQDGLSKQSRRLKGRATPLRRLKGRASAGALASPAAESAVQRESLARRADAVAALVERFVAGRGRATKSGLSERSRRSAAALCGRQAA